MNPAPTDASSTRSPFFSRPCGMASLKRQRNGRRRGVAVALDVDDDLLRRQAEPLGRRHDDSAVGLVGHEEIDVVRRDACCAARMRLQISSVFRTANLNTAWPSCFT